MTDLEVEAAALLYWLGYSRVVSSVFIDHLLAAQGHDAPFVLVESQPAAPATAAPVLVRIARPRAAISLGTRVIEKHFTLRQGRRRSGCGILNGRIGRIRRPLLVRLGYREVR